MAPVEDDDDDDDEWLPAAGDELMAVAKGLEANNDESWNGEKLDRLISAERGDDGEEGLIGPLAVLMLLVEAAGAISLSGLM